MRQRSDEPWMGGRMSHKAGALALMVSVVSITMSGCILGEPVEQHVECVCAGPGIMVSFSRDATIIDTQAACTEFCDAECQDNEYHLPVAAARCYPVSTDDEVIY